MFGALSFVSVRQQHHQPAPLLPLVFGRRDVLIDYDLGTVREITELSFPRNELVLSDDRVSVFETEHARFTKAAVKNIKPCVRIVLVLEVAKRRPSLARHCVVHRRMPLRKSSTP